MIALAELKARLRVSGTAAHDDALTALEAGAVAFMETQTNRYFGPIVQGEVRRIDGDGGDVLYLADVSAVTSIETYDGAAWVALDAAEYDVVAPRRPAGLTRVYRLPEFGEWPNGRRLVRLTADFGYAEGQEPKDVRDAVAALVAWAFGGGAPGLKSESVGGYSYTRAALEELPGVKATIDSYRVRPL